MLSPYVEKEARKLALPLFPLGQVVITPGAESVILSDDANNMRVADLLDRHMRGDWGVVCAEDKALNDDAVVLGNRILSAYSIDEAKPCDGEGLHALDNILWIITEADRSSTTILLPEEY